MLQGSCAAPRTEPGPSQSNSSSLTPSSLYLLNKLKKILSCHKSFARIVSLLFLLLLFCLVFRKYTRYIFRSPLRALERAYVIPRERPIGVSRRQMPLDLTITLQKHEVWCEGRGEEFSAAASRIDYNYIVCSRELLIRRAQNSD